LRKHTEGQPSRPSQARNAKVDQLDAVLAIDNDVFGLDIAMYYTVRVNIPKCFADRRRDPDSPIHRKLSTFAQQMT
jgi:hypothetical protein